jgi:hypothetical protein
MQRHDRTLLGGAECDRQRNPAPVESAVPLGCLGNARVGRREEVGLPGRPVDPERLAHDDLVRRRRSSADQCGQTDQAVVVLPKEVGQLTFEVSQPLLERDRVPTIA